MNEEQMEKLYEAWLNTGDRCLNEATLHGHSRAAFYAGIRAATRAPGCDETCPDTPEHRALTRRTAPSAGAFGRAMEGRDHASRAYAKEPGF